MRIYEIVWNGDETGSSPLIIKDVFMAAPGGLADVMSVAAYNKAVKELIAQGLSGTEASRKGKAEFDKIAREAWRSEESLAEWARYQVENPNAFEAGSFATISTAHTPLSLMMPTTGCVIMKEPFEWVVTFPGGSIVIAARILERLPVEPSLVLTEPRI